MQQIIPTPSPNCSKKYISNALNMTKKLHSANFLAMELNTVNDSKQKMKIKKLTALEKFKGDRSAGV